MIWRRYRHPPRSYKRVRTAVDDGIISVASTIKLFGMHTFAIHFVSLAVVCACASFCCPRLPSTHEWLVGAGNKTTDRQFTVHIQPVLELNLVCHALPLYPVGTDEYIGIPYCVVSVIRYYNVESIL